MLYVSDFNIKMFTPVFNISLNFENNTIMFISFIWLLAKVEIVQQSNNIRPRSSNESLMNVVFRATEISASFDASSIILEGVKRSKK